MSAEVFDDADFDDVRREWSRETLVRSLVEQRAFFEMRISEIEQALELLGSDRG